MNIFDKLNTPQAVIAILVIIVAVNGLLLFQQRNNDPAPTETAQNEPTNEESDSGQTADSSDTTDSTEDDSTRTSQPPEETSTERQDATDEARETERTQEEDEPGAEEPEAEDRDEPEAEEPEEPASDEQQQEEEPQDQEQPDEPRLLLAGLGGAFGNCERDPEDCVQNYMDSNVSDSRYLGGRVDLAATPQTANSEVLYFESSELGVCEFEREVYESSDGQNYTVILIGEGSVQTEEGNECIPTA